MKDKLQKHSRWLILAVSVIVIHLIIGISIRGCSRTSDASGNTAAAKEKSQSWFKRLFSKSNTTKEPEKTAEKEKNEQSVKPEQPELKPPKPVVVYRKACRDLPLFGKPFDFSSAKHGELPNYYAPGSNGAKSAIVVDLSTRKVLWEKNCRMKTGTASMAKLMTLLLFMEHLDANENITLDTIADVPKAVMNVPRSGVVYLAPGEKFPSRDIVKAAAVKSANDAAEMLALSIVKDSKDFPALMNQKAAQLGMKSTRFINAHGLTEKIAGGKFDFSTSSALDMVILGERLLEYPVMMEFFSTQEGRLRDTKPLIYTNTNKLINPRYPGVDGMKTGYTKAAGFCLLFSAKRNGKRIMGCVTGFKTPIERDRFCRKLVDWAFEPEKKIPVKKSTPATVRKKSAAGKSQKRK